MAAAVQTVSFKDIEFPFPILNFKVVCHMQTTRKKCQIKFGISMIQSNQYFSNRTVRIDNVKCDIM